MLKFYSNIRYSKKSYQGTGKWQTVHLDRAFRSWRLAQRRCGPSWYGANPMMWWASRCSLVWKSREHISFPQPFIPRHANSVWSLFTCSTRSSFSANIRGHSLHLKSCISWTTQGCILCFRIASLIGLRRWVFVLAISVKKKQPKLTKYCPLPYTWSCSNSLVCKT